MRYKKSTRMYLTWERCHCMKISAQSLKSSNVSKVGARVHLLQLRSTKRINSGKKATQSSTNVCDSNSLIISKSVDLIGHTWMRNSSSCPGSVGIVRPPIIGGGTFKEYCSDGCSPDEAAATSRFSCARRSSSHHVGCLLYQLLTHWQEVDTDHLWIRVDDQWQAER